MYKKQMTLQRITSYLLLIAAVLVFVYSLGIMTDMSDSLSTVSKYKETNKNYVKGATIFIEMQPFNNQLIMASIGLILSAVALFVFQTHSRRKYYIANYITVGVNAIANIGVAIWGITNVFAYRDQYRQIDFDKLFEVAAKYKRFATDSEFWFDICLVAFIPLIIVTLLSIGNLIWKIVLMRAERKLIEEGKEA